MTSPLGLSARTHRAIAYLNDLWSRREFAWFLALGNIKARNASTVLGLLWWVLNPLLLGMVYYLVFGFILGTRDIGYLLSGMFVFHFTSQSMSGGANSILQNTRLLANLRFPRMVLPLSNLVESTVGFLSSMLVLLLITAPLGRLHLSTVSLILPVIIVAQMVFNLGLGALTARLAVPFRDINNIIPYVNRLWLYLSPVIWPLSFLDRVSINVGWLIEMNPMFPFLVVYRAALLGEPMTAWAVVAALWWATVVGGLGLFVFVRYENKMVRYL